jgi:outer membrane lipopolysaccharide assembly protein LptE/RlpB
MKPLRSKLYALLCVCAAMLLAGGCGYHTSSGKPVRLPADLHSVAIPIFKNTTTSYGVEQVLTRAVVREFLERTQYRVVAQSGEPADATLQGTILSVQLTPLTTDSQTGRLSSAMVSISVKVSLTDRQGKVLYENPAYVFRDQYQLSRDPSSFFQEEGPAMDRIGRDFARTLVSNVLEAY